MGRGLSPLQRWILREAATHGSLYLTEILVGHFGWEPRTPLRRLGEGSLSHWTTEKLRAHKTRDGREVWEGHEIGDMAGGGMQYFTRQAIGYDRYRRTMATLSRSIRRLEERGLITYWRWGAGTAPHVRLTAKGREWLSVNTEHNAHC